MITLHHLTFSRSTRVLWLLEELGLPYELVVHERDANHRAPASLKAVHPLGKAPVIVDDGLMLAESSAILRHVDERHGGSRFMPPAGSDAASVHDEWLQYAESSAAMPILLKLIGGMMGGLTPGLTGFVDPALTATLDYVAAALTPGPYLMGEQFTLADIQMAYLLILAESRGMVGDRTAIRDYLGRLNQRPALAKAIEIGGLMALPQG